MTEEQKARKREWRAKYREANREKVRAQNAKRRAAKLQRTPKWASHERMNKIYAVTKLHHVHVDHIVPLQGKNVWGLHVENNLQFLHPSENVRKHAKFDPETHVHEMPEVIAERQNKVMASLELTGVASFFAPRIH